MTAQDDSAALLARLLPGARHEETHLSHVFITDQDVYKLKKPMALSFADFSTAEARRVACENEIAVNRPYAPALYRGVVPLTLGPEGPAIGGDGEPCDWLVHMAPFPAEGRLDKRVDAGMADRAALQALTDSLWHGHDAGPAFRNDAWPQTLRGWTRDIGATLAAQTDACAARDWQAALEESFGRHSALLAARGRSALRACHGDLHLKNICTLDGALVPYDALEFDPVMTRIDPLYDMAFLIMDLVRHGATGAANGVMNRYLGLSGDYAPARLLPGYLSLRAAIRAMAEALAGRKAEGEAYLDLARTFLRREARPAQLLIGGRSGTGKSTLAAGLAPTLPPPPGAVHLRSDVIRKRLAGVMPEEKLSRDAYAGGATEAVYHHLAQAFAALAGEMPVIADATFLGRGDTFGGNGTVRIWLTAGDAVLERRLALRRGDASDADAEVLRRQRRDVPGPSWHVVSSGQSREATLSALRALLR